MLSRTAIRPYQTMYLLDQGVLPVSIDYRFCPEISILNGAVLDCVDALHWIQKSLPNMAKRKDFIVDVNKIVAIGYSTGGHLAMMLCTEAPKVGITPPNAVLGFYPPANCECD